MHMQQVCMATKLYWRKGLWCDIKLRYVLHRLCQPYSVACNASLSCLYAHVCEIYAAAALAGDDCPDWQCREMLSLYVFVRLVLVIFVIHGESIRQ